MVTGDRVTVPSGIAAHRMVDRALAVLGPRDPPLVLEVACKRFDPVPPPLRPPLHVPRGNSRIGDDEPIETLRVLGLLVESEGFGEAGGLVFGLVDVAEGPEDLEEPHDRMIVADRVEKGQPGAVLFE